WGPGMWAMRRSAARRHISICHMRSWAITQPCAKKRSSVDCAVMCGTPHVSRTTVTGAFRPLTFRLPSIWASDAFATVLISAEGWAATVATKSSPAAESAIRIQPPIPNLQPLLQDLLHVVHDAIHLLQRQLQRLARRHVDARVLEQIDRVPGAARGEEGEVALRGGGVAGQYFFRQRRRSRERRRVLE